MPEFKVVSLFKSLPYNHRREPCPRCGRDCFVQGFAEQGYESWCLLCGYVQTWAAQVLADCWRRGTCAVEIP